MKEFRKRLWFEVALCASFLNLIHSSVAYSVDPKHDLDYIADASDAAIDVTQNSYTINYNNISIIELIRFVSKITGLNFVFEEADLQFTVTVVSEEPVSARNVMSALAQVLRVHDLMLLEQESNVLIVKSNLVNQIPTIISSDLPDSQAGNAALVTQVFRIKNANVNSVAGIIRPMTSKGSLIEVSNETRQLIVTDITTNVEKIAALLASLDAPHTSLDIETYVVKNIAPQELISLTHQLLTPFAEGNPLIFVPQAETNSIFIVSTPYLIERAMAVMEDLDIPPKEMVVGQKMELGKNVYIYKVVNRPAADLLSSLSQISKQIKSTADVPTPIQTSIDDAQVLQDTNSLLFIGDPDTITRIKDMLVSLDTPYAGGIAGAKNNFLIYTPQFRTGEEIEDSLNEIKKNLQSAELVNPPFLSALQSMQWVPSNNTLIFTGDPESLDRINTIIKTIDVQSPYTSKSSQVFVYKPQYASNTQIQNALQLLVPTLDPKSIADQNLAKAINSMEWSDETQSFIVTSDPATIARLKELLLSLDNPQELTGKTAQGFFLYKLKYVPGDGIIDELKKIGEQIPTSNIKNQNVVNAISKIQWVKKTNSLLITGSSDAIDQVKLLIAEFDIPGGAASKTSFLIYKPQVKTIDEIETAVSTMTQDLEESGLIDPDLFAALSSMKYVESTQSLIFTGGPATLDKVKEMLQRIDSSTGNAAIQHIGKVTFLVYKLQYVSADQLMSSLKNFAYQLQNSNIQDKELVRTINDMRYIKETNSLLFIGPSETLQRIDTLAQKFDNSTLVHAPAPERPAASYVVYSPKYLAGEELISVLCDFENNLVASGVTDSGLFDAINNLKWIDKTSSLLISGDEPSVVKVQELLEKFDVPAKGSGVPSIESIDNTSFLVYKLQYHQGSDIRDALKQVGHSLSKSTTTGQTNLMNAINSLQWIQVTNSLLGTGQQDVLLKLKDLIENLDVPLRQVFIEVLVIETQLTDTQNFGLMWGSQVQYMNKTILSTGNFPVPGSNNNSGTGSTTPVSTFAPILQNTTATNTPAGGLNNVSGFGGVPFVSGFDLGVIGDIIMHKGKSFISLGSLVNALQLDSNTTIVMNPKIVAQDNQQSIIFVGQNIPYTGAVVSTVGQSSQQTTSNIEYRDVGVSLTITPILGNNDIVTLDIVHDISEAVATTNSSSNNSVQLTGITTNHTHMETRVHVPDQHFVALSGMIQDSKARYRTAIPCLGGLPVVGALFSENDRTDSKSNIIIFMRPFIINTYDEYKKITEHQEWLYKEQAGIPVLKEDFDAGLDWVKSPENE